MRMAVFFYRLINGEYPAPEKSTLDYSVTEQISIYSMMNTIPFPSVGTARSKDPIQISVTISSNIYRLHPERFPRPTDFQRNAIQLSHLIRMEQGY